MTNLRKCNQTRCGYFMAGQGCRKCEQCQAEPYIIDEDCDVCWNCEHDEGLLRWNDENGTHEEKAKEKEKPIEIPVNMEGR
jgi:anaerobic ribonucleoside-triphosphate reductase